MLEVVGVECLFCWNYFFDGVLFLGLLIEVVELYNMMSELGYWMFE